MSIAPDALVILVVAPDDGSGMRDAVLELFDAGHAPVAWDGLAPTRGSLWDAQLEPVSNRWQYACRLLVHCDGVLRLPGSSASADQLVEYALWEGKPVYRDISDVPGLDRRSVCRA